MRDRRSTRTRVIVGTTALCAVAALGGVGAPLAAASGPSISVSGWLSGLNAPRGVAFDGAGNFYVAESGLAGDAEFGMTTTGRVSRYHLGSTSPDWSTGTSSLYAHEDPNGPADVLGPEGVSAVGRGCTKHSAGDRNGCQVLVIMSESHAGTLPGGQTGELLRFDAAGGAMHTVTDVGDQMYAWTGDHSDLFPSDFPDSNPYAVLVTKDLGDRIRTFVADAGANTIDEVMPDGTLRVVAYIPNETGGAFRDATPTCIAEGPDHRLYVGTLDLVSNAFIGSGGGFSHVYRVDPNADYPTEPTVWASGLTTITACTFDRAGNFWAAEMFGPHGDIPSGALVRIPFSDPGHVDTFTDPQIVLPGGIAQGPDGKLYVSTFSAAPGPAGQVVRVTVTG